MFKQENPESVAEANEEKRAEAEDAAASSEVDSADDAASDSSESGAHETYYPDRGDPDDPASAAAYYARMGLN